MCYVKTNSILSQTNILYIQIMLVFFKRWENMLAFHYLLHHIFCTTLNLIDKKINRIDLYVALNSRSLEICNF